MPPGWTNADSELSAASYWGSEDGGGILMAKRYGFDSPVPIMCSTRHSGSFLYMFKTADGFYIWNELEDDVCKITNPTTENDILSTMRTKGSKALTFKFVDYVD